ALAHSLANEIQKISPDTRVKIFNISQTDKNDIMTQVFVSKAIAVGSPTVGQSILSSVAGWLHFLFELKFKKKKAAVFGCYGWSGEGVEVLEELLIKSGFEVTGPKVKVNWNPKQENLQEMKGIAEALLQ
ncbi:MAG: flavodoxin domain-containing protein, partial [Sphaerochaeta sp.]